MVAWWRLLLPPLEPASLECEHDYVRQYHFAMLPRETQRREQQRVESYWFLSRGVQSQKSSKCASSDPRMTRADEQEVLLCFPDAAL